MSKSVIETDGTRLQRFIAMLIIVVFIFLVILLVVARIYNQPKIEMFCGGVLVGILFYYFMDNIMEYGGKKNGV